jgi:hypothetical protein
MASNTTAAGSEPSFARMMSTSARRRRLPGPVHSDDQRHMRGVSVRGRPVAGRIENRANLRLDELAETFPAPGAIANGSDDLFRRGDADIGRDKELLQRLHRVHVDRSSAIGLVVGTFDDLVETLDYLLLCSGEALNEAVEETHPSIIRPPHAAGAA